MAFEDRGPIKKKGIKVNNDNSTIPQPKPNYQEKLSEKAQEVATKYEEYKSRTWELSTKFKAMMQDHVLSDNKSVLVKDIEAETMNRLVALASEMNEDDNQPEGIGGTALSFLIMKMLLLQRDTINTLLYKVDKLEKILAKSSKNDQ